MSSVAASTLIIYISCPSDTGMYLATIIMSLYCLYLAHLYALNAHLSLYFNYFNVLLTLVFSLPIPVVARSKA